MPSARAFSHGCMRVRDPLKLAELVLAEDRGWTAGRVTAAVRSGPKDNQINLTTKVPVHMTYFTAWVDDDGKLQNFWRHLRPREPHSARRRGQGAPDQAGAAAKNGAAARRPRERVAPPEQTAFTSSRMTKGWMRGVFQY